MSEQQALQAPVDAMRAPSDDYKRDFETFVTTLCDNIPSMGMSFEFESEDMTMVANCYVAYGSVKLLRTFPNELYPSAKIVMSLNCSVYGLGYYGTIKKSIDFAIDIGSGDPFVGVPIEANVEFPSFPYCVSYPAVNTSVLCAFKLHSANQSDGTIRLKDVYDLALLLPEVESVSEFFRANLRLAFASRGHEVTRLKRLLKGPYPHDIEAQWEAFKSQNHLKCGPFNQSVTFISGLIKSLLL